MNKEITPTLFDVLFGRRGKPFTDHPGNVNFRETVGSFYEAYYQNGITINDRKAIMKHVKKKLENEGVRFLKMVVWHGAIKKSSIMDAEYEIADDSAILNLIQQRFINQKSDENKKANNERTPRSPSTPATSEKQFEVCLGVIFKEALEWAQKNPNADCQQLARDFANCDHKKETSALCKTANVMMIQLQGSSSGRASLPNNYEETLRVNHAITDQAFTDSSRTPAPRDVNHSVSDEEVVVFFDDFDWGSSSDSVDTTRRDISSCSFNGSRCNSASYNSSMSMLLNEGVFCLSPGS